MTETTATPVAGESPRQERTRRRRAFAGAISGHAIEWYDYGVYGFLAVFVGQLFFTADEPIVALMSSFAVFALSFFMRPIGGLVFGPMADRLGRKGTLVSVMIMMSGATFLIGLLPTYGAVGVLAPILLVLLRCIQGLSAGGEIGTVTAFIAEYAGPGRRGYSTAWLMFTAVMGLVLGSLIANGLIVALGEETMLAWGWRIPFLIAGPLGAVALFIRLKLEDTPEFEAISERGEKVKSPLRESGSWLRAIALVFGIITLHSSIFYLVLTFASTFMSAHLGFDATVKFWYVLAAGIVSAVVMPLGGAFTDRFGRKPFLLVIGVLATVSMLWFFLAAPGATPLTFIWPLMACALTFGLYASSTYALMTELLPTHIRSTGIALGYNLPVAIFGGSAPLIATWLISINGDITAPWYFFVGTGIVSLISLLILKKSDFARVVAVSPGHMPPDLRSEYEQEQSIDQSVEQVVAAQENNESKVSMQR
ncbi:MFS transporter [Gulosibacter molinativorax]|uniref:MFS transporter n=1 Tax=Gulosibacter molinativorax TaxID=256821 RepID=A0ABT7C9N7_9MICO|nr:MFS transporter [Gulosibacter molinativorax]MDJ1371875.1 MFS transporter [Gulosibacter molinativorax]QUY62524.1 Major facilitator superfamily MFS_1 [Gulosibacter molinativorax]